MQITFTGSDGASVTVSDTRRQDTSIVLPEGRNPAAWVLGKMRVTLPDQRTPAAWILGQMQVTLPEERRPAGWIAGAMKV